MNKEEDSRGEITSLTSAKEIKSIDRLENARIEKQIATIKRQEKIEAADEWTYFWGSKLVGFAGISVGALEILIPTLITVSLPVNPIAFIGGGLALVGGKKSISMIKRLLEISSSVFGDDQ